MPKTPAPRYVLIPFAREKSRHIVVVARLAGRPVRFVVDTGAGATCVDSGVLSRYQLKLSSNTRKGGGVGTSTMRMTTLAAHDLGLGELDLSDVKLVALDLSHVNAGFERAKVEPIVGVLGADVLGKRHAVIDYAKQVLLLRA